jgi:hypothetical protein
LGIIKNKRNSFDFMSALSINIGTALDVSKSLHRFTASQKSHSALTNYWNFSFERNTYSEFEEKVKDTRSKNSAYLTLQLKRTPSLG